jgi:hypothetical protein
MILRHHDLMVELDDAWWAEAQMSGFVPSGICYRAEPDARWGRAMFEAPIEPKSSSGVGFLVWLTHLGYGVFHDPPNIFGELSHSFVGKLRVIL